MAALRALRRPIIAIHGGAWAVPDSLREASLRGVAAAANAGMAKLLSEGGSALDAVEAAVRSLELDAAFDAGRGAVLNCEGNVELDAVIMDGAELRSGAVAALGPVLHPVSLARHVMEKTEHCLLVGEGATAFARECGVEILAADDLVTEAAKAEWQAMAAYPKAVNTLFNDTSAAQQKHHDTVGAVAMDAYGNLAAATSTGGITFKRAGRVGDSPILGAGCLADNALGAISTTGHGESIMRYTLASRVLQRMSLARGRVEEEEAAGGGRSARTACAAELEGMLGRVGGRGGAVVLSPSGEAGVAFSTIRMPWAVCTAPSTSGAEPELRFGIDRKSAEDASGVEVVDVEDM